MYRLRGLSRTGRLLLALAVGGVVFGIASVVQADIPDNGVIHGCYGKAGTPYKGNLRVRDASQGEQCRFYENQLDWSQSGATGATGPTGPIGPPGATGPTGPTGATSFATTLLQTGVFSQLADLGNGVTLEGACEVNGNGVRLRLSASTANLQASGTRTIDSAVGEMDVDSITTVTLTGLVGVDLDVIARDKSVGPFARLDAHAHTSTACTFWGMIIPST